MDRRLGEPLPHQLPNPTRADLSPINLSPTISLWRAYTVLIQVSLGCSVARGTFPRVTNPSAADARRRPLDLHVLSLPPAFVLSQDQTLKLKRSLSGPFLTAEPLHIAPTSLEAKAQTSSFVVHRSHKEPKPTNGEADTHIIGSRNSLMGRHANSPVAETKPNRPHIPSSHHELQ